MNQATINQLEKLYDRLYGNYVLKYKKSNVKSLLMVFLDIKSNDRLRLIVESGVKVSSIPFEIKNDLIKSNLIRNSSNLDEFIITGKGVYEFEKTKGFEINELIDFMDDKLFNMVGDYEKNLSEKQKLILFSMITGRSFSENSVVDLKKSDRTSQTWGEIFSEGYKLCKQIGIVQKLTEEDLFGKAGNEHPVSNVFRHTDALPKLTKMIYTAKGSQKYFLNLVDENNNLNETKLKFLFEKIFEGLSLDISIINDLSDFFRKIIYSKDVYLYDPKKHVFSKPEYDHKIKDVLMSI